MSRNSLFTMRLFLTAALATLLSAGTLRAEVRTVPAPEGHAVKDAYRVEVDGQEVAVYRSRDQEPGSGEYYFATFEFDGEVSVKIAAPFDLGAATVAPERFGVEVAERGEKIALLKAREPFMISFEPNGRVKPLILFGLAPETDAPKEGDENVVYFGPGVHSPGVVNLTDNQTLYVAAGAVLNAGINAKGENITIRGRGVVSGSNWKRFEGPSPFIINATNCKNLQIRDLVLRDPWSWTCVLTHCEDAVVDGLRICASNMINDDALDLVNSRRVVVKNCFFRAQDDSIAIKGKSAGLEPCEDIEIYDCVFWTDRANVFRVGYECEASTMRNIVARNIDVLYYSVNYRDHDQYWANAIVWLQPNQDMTMEKCRFEDVRVRSNGDMMIMLMAKPMSCEYGSFKNPTPGRLRDCALRRFTVYGEKGDFTGELYVAGFSQDSDVRNLEILDFDYFGEKIDSDSPCVVVGEYVDGLTVKRE